MRRARYLLQEAMVNIRSNQTTTLVAVLTTAFTMACFGVFLLLYLNVHDYTTALQQDVKVTLYLDEGVSDQTISRLRDSFAAEPEVASVAYVSKAQALAEFRQEFPSEGHLLDGLGENPLPASLVVTFARRVHSSDAVAAWIERAKQVPGIAQVQYDREWIEMLVRVVRYLEWSAAVTGTILGIASVTIIASTVRLTLYARRQDIEILRLIGATRAFIRIPYVIEGAVLGAIGGLASLSVLKAGFEFFRFRLSSQGRLFGGLPPFTFLPFPASLGMIAAAVVLGSVASMVSVSAFERSRP